MKVRLILFKDGRRLEKYYDDHTEAIPIVRKLKRNGIKATLVTCKVASSRALPPAHDDLSARAEGMLWCPYCGAWRWFKVPEFRKGATFTPINLQAYLNSCYRQGLKVCAWCCISENEFSVCVANGTWGNKDKRRRRKRRVSTRR